MAYECDDTLRLGSLAAVYGSSSPSGAFERVPNLRLSPPAHNRQQVLACLFVYCEVGRMVKNALGAGHMPTPHPS